jgi:hypothetical protein
MKTAREWFETFPEPYRSQALHYLNIAPRNSLESYLYADAINALESSFFWNETNQGYTYWDDFCKKLENKEL